MGNSVSASASRHSTTLSAKEQKHLADHYGTSNYKPLDVVLCRGEAEWVWDMDGNRYVDMLSAYSAVSHGHCHPRLQKVLAEQASRLTLTSRAFYHDQLGLWLKTLVDLCGMEMAIAMNSGAEAVETAIKVVRKWGYENKKIPLNQAEIIVCENNFHGRTTTIVGFSTEEKYKKPFGPYGPGFKCIPFNDASALKAAITPNTVAFLVEPIQGEAGVIVPSEGYLSEIRSICTKHNVLLVLDEIQTGLARTGKMFAHQYEDCQPDLMTLGKALGGGFYPISAVVGSREVLGILKPGEHGSTFGGNPLACALSLEAMAILVDEKLTERSDYLGEMFRNRLKDLPSHIVKEVRGKGLLNGIEIQPAAGTGAFYVGLLRERGILAKDTHVQTIRFAPPLVIEESTLNEVILSIKEIFAKTQDEWLQGKT